MLGRSTETALISDVLATVSAGGAALVIEGEAGIGKSTLLHAAVEMATADGFRMLGCSGVQSQAEVGFAGIHELIQPLLGQAGQLPRRHRDALLTAFGMQDGPAPDRLLIGLAVLGLLEEASAQHRLLLVVDDLQWLDTSSRDVLAFVARRLANAPLLLLCAERVALGASGGHLEGLPRLRLGPLQPEDAEALMTRTLLNARHGVDDYLRKRVLEQSNGNPLALIELSAALGERPGAAAAFASEPLPTGQRVERAFSAQLSALSDSVRLLLLIIAASDGSVAEINKAAQGAGLSLAEHLAPLEQAGLVTSGGGRISVRHPLIRSTVYGAAALSARTAAHRALADATTDPTRGAWHRAEATFGPDEEVAADLERAAERSLARGAGAESAAGLRRAAMLSPEMKDRARRLASAADAARGAGLTAEAISLLEEAEPFAEERETTSSLAITRFVLNVTAAIPGQSAEGLVTLAETYADGGAGHRELLWAAAIECRMHGLAERPRQAVVEALGRLDDTVQDPLTDIALALVDDIGEGLRLQQRLPDLVARLGEAPLLALSLAFAAEAVSDRDSALKCWSHVPKQSRHRISSANECEALRGSAQLLIQEGRVQAACMTAGNAMRLAEDMNLPMTAASAAAILSRALAWRGEAESARQALDHARGLLAVDPAILWNDDAHWAAGLAALCAANHADALHHLLKMSRHRTSRRWAIADLAEAAAGCERPESVRPLLDDIEAQASRLGMPLENMLVRRSRALLADSDGEAEQHFTAALSESDGLNADLELGRTRLLYGEWLRRRRRIVEARTHLAAALAVFDTAGAVPFADRAAAELRAAGGTASGTVKAGPATTLTSQELQIAQLAASGLTNREIADRIYLSHHTVAAHLYKVFPKLGITSRSQLHAALGSPAQS
jgi:DNA-binding CsgD family transcriptional regulator